MVGAGIIVTISNDHLTSQFHDELASRSPFMNVQSTTYYELLLGRIPTSKAVSSAHYIYTPSLSRKIKVCRGNGQTRDLTPHPAQLLYKSFSHKNSDRSSFPQITAHRLKSLRSSSHDQAINALKVGRIPSPIVASNKKKKKTNAQPNKRRMRTLRRGCRHAR